MNTLTRFVTCRVLSATFSTFRFGDGGLGNGENTGQTGRRPGTPKTGGRQKGTPNKVTNKGRIDLEELARQGEMPLPFLLSVMRDDEELLEVRLNAAKAAAPYCHRALKAMAVTGEDGGAVQRQHNVEIHIVDHRPADQD